MFSFLDKFRPETTSPVSTKTVKLIGPNEALPTQSTHASDVINFS